MSFEPGWNWGNAWTGLRRDVNVLAWLIEEERTIQRLYMESFVWALTGERLTVDEFARALGSDPSLEGPADEHERAAAGALDGGGEGEKGLGSDCPCRRPQGEAPEVR